MVFSSLTFLLIFFPVTAFLYYLPGVFGARGNNNALTTYKNIILCAVSFLFYAWGEPVNIILMLVSILFNYAVGLDMKAHEAKPGHRKFLMAATVIFDLGLLGFFKYGGFVAENLSLIPGLTLRFNAPGLPIGISFYTFQILSYVIDVYRNKSEAQKSLLDFALYISMFPQLIAGPIVQYGTIETQLRGRKESLSAAAQGIYLFVIGLAKKVILANSAGAVYEEFFANGTAQLSAAAAWSAMLFYAFQIYFDFSGYSDMARGLGGVFGFEFPENFNYPYFADSVTDFWRRWHITLSSWFRDYVYIPLGGNRCSKARHIFNLFVVWALTGLWHGAAWNFLLWGVYYFVLLVLEKYVFAALIEKLPHFFRRILTFVFVLFGWVLFASADLPSVMAVLSAMFGKNALCDPGTVYLLSSNTVLLGLLAVFSVPLYRFREMKNKFGKFLICLVLLILSLICLIGDTYNPFLYFRF